MEILAGETVTLDITLSPLSSGEPGVSALESELLGNRPNPFSSGTDIWYSLKEAGPVDICIYNLKGERIATLVNGNKNPGQYSAFWNGRDDNNQPVATGIYWIRMHSGNSTSTRKMVRMQ